MKKIVTSVISAFFLLFSVTAYEWGGLVTENFKATSVDPSITDNIFSRQSNSISLWANIHFLNNENWYLKTQASYKYNYTFNGFNKNGNLNSIIDLDLLKLSGTVNIKDLGLSFSMGRYIVVDNTAKIFAQNCDGFSFKVSKSFINFGAYLGYTGLLNGNNVATLNQSGSVETNVGNLYTSNHPYLPISVFVDFPSLFLNQSVGFQGSTFIDLTENQYNRFYGTFSLKGPIGGPAYYTLMTSFGSENLKTLTNYSTISFLFFINQITLKVNCEYASGNQLIFSAFRGFNSSLAYNASWNPEYSGVLLPGFDLIYSNKSVCFELNGKFVMQYPEEKIIIKGISVNAKSILNVFSDLSFDLGLSIYHDLETMGKTNNYSGSIGASISF